MRHVSFPFAAVACLALVVPTWAQEVPATDEVVADHWFVCFHASSGKKTGWSHSRRVHGTRDGVRVWISEHESVLDRGPGGEKLEKPMRFSTRFVEDEDGKVLAYATSADIGMPSGSQTREGRVDGDEIAFTADGKPGRVPYPAGAVGPAWIDRTIAAQAKAGAAGELVAFRAMDATAGPLKWKAEGMTEPADILGRWLWLVRVEKDDGSGLPDLSFPDGQGGEWAGAVNAGLQNWLRTEEDVAKADLGPDELLRSRIVPTATEIALAPGGTAPVLRLRRKGGPVGEIPEDRIQTVVGRGDDGSVDLRIGSAEPPEGTEIVARPYAGKADHAASLAATPLLELSHPRVKLFADTAVSELINAVRCARMIELFVKMNLRPAAANVGFATAAETISSGTGDWTESAVLSVALARASGLPARLVAGFVYWPAADWPEGGFPHGAFAPHTWAEVLVAEDTWFPIDPVRMDGTKPKRHVDDLVGHGGFDATHVAVLRSDLDTETPYRDILAPVLRFMDGLSVEVAPPADSGGK